MLARHMVQWVLGVLPVVAPGSEARVSRALGSRWLLLLPLFAACALMVVLAVRLIALNRAYAELRMRVIQPHEGDAVPVFLATTLSGDTLTIGESTDPAARQVLFVLTTTCPFCRATLPVWAELADSLARLGDGHIRVVGISLDSLGQSRRYAVEHAIRYPVVTLLNEKLRRLYRAKWVPQTVVLDAEGTVLYAHVGTIQDGPMLDSVYWAATRTPLTITGGRPASAVRETTAAAVPRP